MLHGHPYLVIKVHEERRDQGVSSKPHTRLETVQVHANASQHKGKRHEWPPDEDVGEADTESLKHQMEGNLLSMLRTIRELDRLANGSRRVTTSHGTWAQHRDRQGARRSLQGRTALVAPADQTSTKLTSWTKTKLKKVDLHRFNLLLRQALSQLQHSTRKPVSRDRGRHSWVLPPKPFAPFTPLSLLDASPRTLPYLPVYGEVMSGV
uniref:Uncharacterized protein n=1 Tax=Ixodes ricinus TaxID=34613 RepID=A0A090X9Y9_IXORI